MVKKKIKTLRHKYRYPVILMREMVRTDFKVKYQDSVLGYMWSVLRPLFLFGILYTVFTVGLRVGRGIENWPVALMAGIVIWQFFTDVTKGGLKAIVGHGGLLRKIKFPRYTVVISGTISSFIALAINLCLVTIFAVISGVSLLPTLPLVIFLIVEVFIFSLGLAFLLGAINVRFRDIGHIWDIILRGTFYASAIIYPLSIIADQGEKGVLVSKVLLSVNPIAQAIQDFRQLAINPDIVTLSSLGSAWLYLIPISVSIGVMIFGAWYFRRKSPYFAEEF